MISGAGAARAGAVHAEVLLPASADILRRHLLGRSRIESQYLGECRVSPALRSGRHITAGN